MAGKHVLGVAEVEGDVVPHWLGGVHLAGGVVGDAVDHVGDRRDRGREDRLGVAVVVLVALAFARMSGPGLLQSAATAFAVPIAWRSSGAAASQNSGVLPERKAASKRDARSVVLIGAVVCANEGDAISRANRVASFMRSPGW